MFDQNKKPIREGDYVAVLPAATQIIQGKIVKVGPVLSGPGQGGQEIVIEVKHRLIFGPDQPVAPFFITKTREDAALENAPEKSNLLV